MVKSEIGATTAAAQRFKEVRVGVLGEPAMSELQLVEGGLAIACVGRGRRWDALARKERMAQIQSCEDA